MRALAVHPLSADSARLIDTLKEPTPAASEVLVETLAVGICGTDREIIAGKYGQPPPGDDYLILGHESLGRVIDAPEDCGLAPGNLVVGIVRRPDPIPCPNCAEGEWDMCRNGLYTEHGIKKLHGFCRERFSAPPESLVRIDPSLGITGVLVEPASVVAKAWEHIERIGNRARWEPTRVVVTGAGPIGLLAALMGVQRKMEVHVFDRTTHGPKPALVHELGAHYHFRDLGSACKGAEIVIECTGSGALIYEAMRSTRPNGIVCLTGISSGERILPVDMAQLNRNMVLENDVVFGSVNANRRHYQQAEQALRRADPQWLGQLIARREPIEQWMSAMERRPNDVKTALFFSSL